MPTSYPMRSWLPTRFPVCVTMPCKQFLRFGGAPSKPGFDKAALKLQEGRMVQPVAAGVARRSHAERLSHLNQNLACHDERHTCLQGRHTLQPSEDQSTALYDRGH